MADETDTEIKTEAVEPDPFHVVLDQFKLETQKQTAARDNVPLGSFRCSKCSAVKLWEESCCANAATTPDEYIDVERRKEVRRIIEIAYSTIPKGLDWCRIGNADWEEKCCSAARSFAKKWTRRVGSAVLRGRTGAGKTIASIAVLHKVLDAARDRQDIAIKDMVFAAGCTFVSAHQLAVDRRNNDLFEEAPLVNKAKRASLLVLDEIGFEVFNPERDTSLFEVIDIRYLNALPTILTTNLSEGNLRKKYGEALCRRMMGLGPTIPIDFDEK